MGHGMAITNGPHPVDVHIGRRVRERRVLLGMSQERLGEALGLTFQQVQKYERGTNRISGSRLHHLSRILGVTPGWFFEGLDGEDAAPSAPPPAESEPMHRRETLELVRAYYRVPERMRGRLYSLVKSMGDIAGTAGSDEMVGAVDARPS